MTTPYNYANISDMAVTVTVTPTADGKSFDAEIEKVPGKENILGAIGEFMKNTPTVDSTTGALSTPILLGGSSSHSSRGGRSRKGKKSKGGKSRKARKSLRRK